MAIRTITESLYIGRPVFGPDTEAQARLWDIIMKAAERAREAMPKNATWRNGRP